MWRNATDREKAPFVKKAAAHKKKYEAARAKYVRSAGYKKYMSAKKEHMKTNKIMKKVKKPASYPKRAMSAYFHFLNKHRAKFTKELARKGVTGREACTRIAKMGGQRWAACTGKERATFEKLAAADKKKAARKMATFKKSRAYKNWMEAKKEAKREMRRAQKAQN